MAIAVEQIWKTYHAKLHGFIKKRVEDPAMADDLLQEVFIKVHNNIGKLKSAQTIQSWIYQITRNTIIDYYRTHRLDHELPQSLPLPASEAEPADKARREIAACLIPMIQALPPHYREALMMSEINGLSQKEVAAKQKLSWSGAKSRIQRGRAMLKEMLLECCQFELDNTGQMIDYERKGEKPRIRVAAKAPFRLEKTEKSPDTAQTPQKSPPKAQSCQKPQKSPPKAQSCNTCESQ